MKRLFTLALFLSLVIPALAQQKVVPQGGFNTVRAGPTSTNLWLPLTTDHWLYTVSAYNSGASDIYLMAFDTNTTNVANGSVPTIEPVRIPSSSTGGWSEPAGMYFRRGVLVVASTTPLTLTNTTGIVPRISYFK